MKKKIAIIHYNTPELTEGCIKSLRKTGCDWPIIMLDNSDKRPLKKRMKGVKRIDNTKGQVIDFEKELEKFPDRQAVYLKLSNYGSAKHMMSVQKLWELIPDGFILVESDILVRQDITFLWQEEYASVGRIQRPSSYPHNIPRMLPMLCYMNVPLLTANGARYFDPERTFGLLKDKNCRGNWYDTGAVMLEDIINTKPALVALSYGKLSRRYVHYRHGSWAHGETVEKQKRWLEQYRELW